MRNISYLDHLDHYEYITLLRVLNSDHSDHSKFIKLTEHLAIGLCVPFCYLVILIIPTIPNSINYGN